MSQAFGFSAKGGLNTNLNSLELLGQPGFATVLTNFEVDSDGGYRRVNGFTAYGGASATRPEASTPILGLYPYALGLVAVVGSSIYYTEDGISWTQVNYNTGHVGVTEANLSSQTELDRPNQEQAQFVLTRAPTGHTDNEYGSLTIATGADKVAHFHINGTGASRLFIYEEISSPAAGRYVESHDKHLVVVDTENEPSTIYISAIYDDRTFTGTGAGAIAITDRITGIKSFRDSLYIFCQNTIHRLDDINGTPVIVQITNNIGCLSAYSIQEIGGDLLFLSPDGIRSVAATARIGDVELSSSSRQIQKIIGDLGNSIDTYTISSCVVRDKSQYRLFYSGPAQSPTDARGIIGTFTGQNFEWSETKGIQAFGLVSALDIDGIERIYHGDKDGYIYNHDTGSSFLKEGSEQNILATYETSDLDFGDIGTRKTLKYVRISISPEGSVTPVLRLRYDYKSTDIQQPNDYNITGIPLPAIFGTSVFGTATFGGTNDPMVRVPVEGSGNTVSLRIRSNDTNLPYAINGFYIDYMPSGRR